MGETVDLEFGEMGARPPYWQMTPDQWAEVRALYQAGATATMLAERLGCSLSTIYKHMRRHDCRKRDRPAPRVKIDPDEAREQARAMKASPEESACRALGADASLGDAARAAAETAIAMLRDAQPTRSYTYARLAGTLERLARGTAMEGGDGDGTERGRLAALDFLRGIPEPISLPLIPANAGSQPGGAD